MRHLKKFLCLSLLAWLSAFVVEAQTGKFNRPKHQQLAGPVRTPPPRTFDAQHYILRTRFDRKTKTVWGDETLTFKPLADGCREIRLDATGLAFDAVTLDGTATALTWRTEKPDKLAIKLDRAYNAADTVSVRLRYHVSGPRKGIYFTPEGTLPDTKVRRPPQIWTQGEPEDNRYWFASRDYPDDFATTEQYITTTAPDEIALGNGKLVETTDNPDGTRTFHWRMDEPHATYLVSLVVGAFVKVEDYATLPPVTTDGPERRVPLEYYTYTGAEDAARKAYAGTPAMLREFVAKTGFPFPFNKYGQTGVGFFSQFEGMENVTATTLADSSVLRSSLFREPFELSPGAQHDVTNLVAHELSHSWFGDLVTCRDWSHIWLNEGWATFMEAVYQESVSGQAGYLQEMRASQELYLNEDEFRYRRPLVATRYQDALQLFDATTYKKGGFVVHMLRRQVGDEPFWQAVNLYLTRNARQNVTTPDLQRAFEEASGQKLDWFFRQWVYQAGFPELQVRYRYDAPKKQLLLTVKQTQTADADTPLVFRLPGVQIAVTTADGPKIETINITERTQIFSFALDKAPTRLLFDADERILKKLDYPQQPDL